MVNVSRFSLYILIIKIIVCEVFNDLNSDDSNTEIGRIAYLDKLFDDPDLLKAITFSVHDKTKIYKEVLAETIEKIDSLIRKMKNNEDIKNGVYYKYLLKNVREYTSQWLSEEIHQLVIETNENKDDLDLKKKRNIAEFIYYTASDFGVNLVMEGKDTSLYDWKEKRKTQIKEKSQKKAKQDRAKIIHDDL